MPATDADLSSQLSGWLSLNDHKPSTPRLGLRWQPSLSLGRSLGAGWKLDAEMTVAAAVALDAPSWRFANGEATLDPYRLWLRLFSRQFEARLGLQKINFGSAALFRPLMWFDALDPRDPLQLSEGVYGLLLRYYFKNNANAWLWGLYGNDDPKGWETSPTAARTPEFGGRMQVPFLSGEAAVTAHFRRIDTGADRAGESRFALDGKWDVGVGLWAEAALVHRSGLCGEPAAQSWQRALTMGIDYTFALGNGLYVLAEQFFTHGAASAFGGGAGGAILTALSARYPLGLLDSLSAVLYFDWPGKQAYNFASWQRTTDHWQFHVMVFWNPARPMTVQEQRGRGLFAGRGFQFLAVWNI